MTCQNCKKETSCGCKSCKDRPAEHKRNIMKANTIQCPYCDFESNYDIWLDQEYKDFVKK